MTTDRNRLEELKESIEQIRDEIKLKAHLGEKETRDELEQLEKKWDKFIAGYKPLLKEAEETAKNAGTALSLAADELKAGYDRIRKKL